MYLFFVDVLGTCESHRGGGSGDTEGKGSVKIYNNNERNFRKL